LFLDLSFSPTWTHYTQRGGYKKVEKIKQNYVKFSFKIEKLNIGTAIPLP